MSKINSLAELAKHYGIEPVAFENFEPGGLESRIARAVYRNTTCGCTFHAFLGGVVISGYAEGADAECESFQFDYPFGIEEFEEQLELCDEEGCQMWDEWNGEEWDDEQEADDRQRVDDMNATLRDIGSWT